MKENQPTGSRPASKSTAGASAADVKPRARENVSIPTASADAPDFRHGSGASKRPTQKKLRRLHKIPVTTLPEDESFDEALEEMIPEDAIVEELPIDAPDDPVTSRASSAPRRTGRRAADVSASEAIRRKNGFSEDDVAMLLELGYESELGRMVGYENLKKLKYEHSKRLSLENHKHYRTAFGYRGTEDVNSETATGIMATYLHDRKLLLRRTLITAFATFILLFLDHPALLGNGFAAFSDSLPLLLPILSLLLLIGASVFSWRQINAGLRSYLKLKPTPYSTTCILLPLTIIYDIVSLFSKQNLTHVNCITCGVLLVLAICDVLRLRCEMRTFTLLSTDTVKTVLEPTPPRKKKLRQGKKLVKIINDDIDNSFYHVHKTEETTGFFRRFNTMYSTHRPFHILLGLTPALGFVSAFAALLVTSNLPAAASVFMTVLVVAAPFSAIFSFFYPLCHANKLLTDHDCALVGEEAVQEYGEPKTIIFADTDLYSAEKCTEIAVREGDDFREDLRIAGILFRKVGGTLESIGRSSATRQPDPPVAFVRIGDFGVEAVVDNHYHVIAGSAEFLKKCGVRVAKESADRALRRAPNVSMMYVAIDGVLKLSYEIEYTVKPEFEALAADLSDVDTMVAVQSYDPNLNELFLENSRGENTVPIRVFKPGRYESDSVLRTCDTGAVTLGEAEDIVYPLHAAKKILSVKKFGIYLQFIISALGATLATVLSLLNDGITAAYLTPFSMAAYHLLWILIIFAVSHIYINRHALHLPRKKDAESTEDADDDSPYAEL